MSLPPQLAYHHVTQAAINRAAFQQALLDVVPFLNLHPRATTQSDTTSDTIMGSYDAYDYAFDDRFATPSFVPPGIEQIRDTIKWRLLHLARSCAPRFENYFRKVDYRITAQRYARWRSTQDKCWYARLPRKIERPAISLNAKTSDQLQSRFFQMPLEVREMIYDYIFDGGAVRLDAQEKVNEKVVRNKEPYKLRSFEPHPGLAVLKACKRTYVHRPITGTGNAPHKMSRKRSKLILLQICRSSTSTLYHKHVHIPGFHHIYVFPKTCPQLPLAHNQEHMYRMGL